MQVASPEISPEDAGTFIRLAIPALCPAHMPDIPTTAPPPAPAPPRRARPRRPRQAPPTPTSWMRCTSTTSWEGTVTRE